MAEAASSKSKEVKEVKEPKAESVKRPDRVEHTHQCDTIMAEILALNEKAKRAKSETERILGDRGGSRVSFACIALLYLHCTALLALHCLISSYFCPP
jgi:hypothetical protein